MRWMLPLFLCTFVWAATDPAGDCSDKARDITSYSVAAANDVGILELTAAADWNFNAVQVFLDTDAGKGFLVAGLGADWMIEGTTLYRYGGSGQEWNWQRVGEVQRTPAGRKLTLRISREQIQADHAKVIFRTLTDNWQTVLDTAPDSGAAELNFAAAPASSPASATPAADNSDPTGDATDPALDITRFEIVQQGAELVVKITAKQASDFGTFLLFFDTDTKADTGFQPPADPRFGFELLVSGEQLLKHAGATRDAWQWEGIGSIKRAIEGNTLTLRIDAGRLNSKQIDAAVWAMSRDWQNLVDRAPDSGLRRVSIDTSKLPPPRPPVKLAPPRADRDLPARQRVRQAQSFYCYYGTSKVAELSHYDLAILHTPQFKTEDLRTLREIGTVTIGYLSVGEDPPPKPRVGDTTGPGGFASWYFDEDKDGRPDMNPIWYSYYANANDPAWRADRVAEARRLVEYGFDGIFLDTLDTASMRPETRSGMIQLVRELRDALPQVPIILNQGFTMLADLAPLADGLMLESFTATYDFESKTYLMNYPQSIDYHLQRVRKDIQPVLEKHPLRVLVLDYAPEHEKERIAEAANRAATFNFLFAVGPISLDDVYAPVPPGKPDPKWLVKMTTPEKLAITLEREANGFPAGTRITPSSSFAGYTLNPLFDGTTDRTSLHWSKAAWASSEDGEAPWLEIALPQPRAGGTLQIDFEPSHPSRSFNVRTRLGDAWQTAAAVGDNTQPSVKVELQSPYRAIRIEQPADGGHLRRPNLLWIAQLHLLP